MTLFVFANNINTTLASSVSSGATTITLSNAANLPSSIPSGSVLVITLSDFATRQNFEILYATAVSGATLTVTRAQEGTSALSWLAGDYAYSPPTAGQENAFGQLASVNTWSAANTFSQPVVVGAATAGTDAIQIAQTISGGAFTVVTGSRAYGTTYTNSTGRPIVVYVTSVNTFSESGLSGFINGIDVVNTAIPPGLGTSISITLIVPNGATYVVAVTSGTSTLSNWCEIR